MKLLSKKFKRIGAVSAVVVFTSAMIATTAFAHRSFFRPIHHRWGHVRVMDGGDFLPTLLATGIIAGITYSIIDSASNPPASTYYVVPPPAALPSTVGTQAVATGSVMVTAQLLNVRSGPSLSQPAVRQIAGGTVLSVCGSAPGWYYVRMADNSYGWVMTQYTKPLTGVSG